MEKVTADALIHEYMQKIYGFAVSRSFDLREAEELSSEIVFQVYTSLLKLPELYNPAGYIWRISENVYSRYVMEKKREQHASLDDVTIPTYDRYEIEDQSDEAQCALLRREIVYLTETRRKIIVAFYFGKKRISEIAKTLELPENTVKWHLSRAKDELKDGMKMNRNIGKLGIEPVRFTCISHNGRPGQNGGPEAYISGLIEQNVLYAVYDTPKTLNEISDELGISPVYLADVVDKLADNGFLTPVGKGKYTTYVEITPATYSLEEWEKEYKIDVEIAELLKTEYIPELKAFVESAEDIYIPGGNRDLLLATLISYAIATQNHPFGEDVDISKYVIRPTDGGYYIVSAEQESRQSDPGYNPTVTVKGYFCCGPMTRWSEKYGDRVSAWSIDTKFDRREGAWQNNRTEDYEYLYEFLCGKLPKGMETVDKYQRLYDRKYLGENDEVQVIVAKNGSLDHLPLLSDELKNKLSTYAGMNYECRKKYYPAQMHDLIRSYSRYVLEPRTWLLILDSMMEEGTLPNFTETERTALNLIVFSDRLPE